MDETYLRAALVGALAEGESLALDLAGWPILLCMAGGKPHAVINRCTHADSALTGGRLRRGAIICPAHGAIFNLTTGACVAASPYPPLRVFPVRIVAEWIEIAVPSDAPRTRATQ
jgi:nitrite reductase/ring-hydroxylating ferredoxin subunit